MFAAATAAKNRSMASADVQFDGDTRNSPQYQTDPKNFHRLSTLLYLWGVCSCFSLPRALRAHANCRVPLSSRAYVHNHVRRRHLNLVSVATWIQDTPNSMEGNVLPWSIFHGAGWGPRFLTRLPGENWSLQKDKTSSAKNKLTPQSGDVDDNRGRYPSIGIHRVDVIIRMHGVDDIDDSA